MDAKTCLQKLQYVGILAFATTDNHGAPQIRSISAVHYEPEALYFFTAKGKDFCRQLLSERPSGKMIFCLVVRRISLSRMSVVQGNGPRTAK